mgnify:CR=1 FL=1
MAFEAYLTKTNWHDKRLKHSSISYTAIHIRHRCWLMRKLFAILVASFGVTISKDEYKCQPNFLDGRNSRTKSERFLQLLYLLRLSS